MEFSSFLQEFHYLEIIVRIYPHELPGHKTATPLSIVLSSDYQNTIFEKDIVISKEFSKCGFFHELLQCVIKNLYLIMAQTLTCCFVWYASSVEGYIQ